MPSFIKWLEIFQTSWGCVATCRCWASSWSCFLFSLTFLLSQISAVKVNTLVSVIKRSSCCDTLPEWGRSKMSNGHWLPHLTHRTSRENQTDWTYSPMIFTFYLMPTNSFKVGSLKLSPFKEFVEIWKKVNIMNELVHSISFSLLVLWVRCRSQCPCDILVLPHSAGGMQQLLLLMTDTFDTRNKRLSGPLNRRTNVIFYFIHLAENAF